MRLLFSGDKVAVTTHGEPGEVAKMSQNGMVVLVPAAAVSTTIRIELLVDRQIHCPIQ